ncbi:Arc family DNA-binding protein [Yangia sp. PrR003]|nr:Arc family DNA-binding protein [Salipiger sp. PrR003]NDV52182.1 Arc family DNA-binding protein [Salipiger sp. PrR003]
MSANVQPQSGNEIVGATLRMPRDLRDEMKIQAIRAGISFNAHVLKILREALPDEATPQK